MLSLSEISLIERLESTIKRVRFANDKHAKYYYGHLSVKDLGVSTPPRLKGLNSVLGWGASAVDALEERILFRGFYSPIEEDVVNLNNTFRDNFLETNQRPVIKDALITGSGFISTAPGNMELGEPEIIHRSESPNNTTGDFNARTGTLDNALTIIRKGNVLEGTLWLPYATIEIIKEAKGDSSWFEVERNEHNLGFVSVEPVINNSDSNYPRGRSEINRALRGHIDHGMRILLGAEVAREFFAMPLRAIMGANKEDFINADGSQSSAWDLIAGKIINVPHNTNDNVTPSIIQLPASNPENIMNLLKPVAQLAAREIGVPPSYFGFETVNPSSADAINEADKKLIQKANKRIPEFGKAWKKAFANGEIIRTGTLPENWNTVETVFMRPETNSPAASADRITKMISSGVFETQLPDFVYRELGFREVEILQLKEFIANKQGNVLIESLLNANGDSAATSAGA